MMQISVDSIVPTASSHKALKTVLPKLHMLAREARFSVKYNRADGQTYRQYDAFANSSLLSRSILVSRWHMPGGHSPSR